LDYVADKLEKEYNKPSLYFSHCTGKRAIKYLAKRFGEEIVKAFRVGDILTFES
jgi:metal-dependent hydrolase (beta-lactamase superfamily II)